MYKPGIDSQPPAELRASLIAKGLLRPGVQDARGEVWGASPEPDRGDAPCFRLDAAELAAIAFRERVQAAKAEKARAKQAAREGHDVRAAA